MSHRDRRWGFLLGVSVVLCPAPGPCRADDARPRRIVFVGDSITDGNTYPALVRQALAEAGRAAPVCVNAGVGGDTAAGMRKRLERDVLAHRPDLVTLSAGINDVLHKVKPADYEADVAAIAERLQTHKVPLVILTTSVLGPRLAKADEELATFNAALRRVARKYGCKVAEVNDRMRKARKAGRQLLDADQVHPNYEGHRIMARAVLDALGHPKVAVPEKLKLALLPGVVREWRMRPVDAKAPPLTEKSVAGLKPDESWKAYQLPEKEPVPGWWNDMERQRGFALSLPRLVGAGTRFQGIARLDRKESGKMYLNTGAHLGAVWLNGRRVYQASKDWHGWHAGRERIPVRLRAGRNTIVIETGEAFFLSFTDNSDW